MSSNFAAEWIIPVTGPPIRPGWVATAGGRVCATGAGRLAGATELGRVAVLPALVNAHIHLELSHLHARIPPAASFGEWVQQVMAQRTEYADPTDARILTAARAAIAQVRATGTGLVGDVSNTLVTVPLLRDADMPAHVFHELTGFAEPAPAERVREARQRIDAAGGGVSLRVSLAPHAPYSVSAGLFAAIRADLDAHPDVVSSVHLGENPEEAELLRHGTGPIRGVLERLGRWPADWQPPGVSPVAYLDDLGFLDSRTLVVHGVQCGADDLSRLRARGSTIVSCPRSNQYVGVGAPPLEAFYASGVAVAFGTDSLASVDDLNLFAELAEARRVAPTVAAARLLASATLVGARALGWDDCGSIEPGRRASLIAVRVPDGIEDVEEYLVSGVPPSAVSWLDAR